MSTTITVITANIRGNPEQFFTHVRRRIRLAIALAGPDGVTFLQECAPSNATKSRFKRFRRPYSVIVAAEARRARKEVYGGHTEIPIILDTARNRIDYARLEPVHGGLAKVSPNRLINQVGITVLRTMEPLDLECDHPASKGHYPANRRGISRLAWRIRALKLYDSKRRTLAVAAVKTGRTVIAGGDMNDPTPTRVHPDQITLTKSGLDCLYAVPGKGKQVTIQRRIFRKRTKAMDHPIVGARITVRNS